MNNSNTGNEPADKYLVDRVLNGDNAAFASIIKNTEALVAQIVFKMMDNREDQKDMAQETYLKVFKSLGGFRFQSKLSTWIAQVAYNTCMDHLRKKKLVLPGNIGFENEAEEYSDESGTTTALMHDPFLSVLRQKEMSGILREAIKQLPPVYKTLITLFHNEEMSYEEITMITGLPEGTVKSYLFRARKSLKKILLLNYQKEDI